MAALQQQALRAIEKTRSNAAGAGVDSKDERFGFTYDNTFLLDT